VVMGGSMCRWSEKNVVKNFVCDCKKVTPEEKIPLRSEKIVCDRKLCTSE